MGDNKKSTVLLTVIAVATLLVAVVGSTFAFFAIQADTEGANVGVETTTASGSDQFIAEGGEQLSLDINNDNMAEDATLIGKTADSATTTKPITVSLTAGSGVAECSYDLIWTNATGVIPNSDPEKSYSTYKKTEVNLGTTETPNWQPYNGKEYTIAGNGTASDNTTLAAIAATNIDEIEANEGGDLVLGSYTITNTYTDAKTPTTHTWNFTTEFWNLDVDQGTQMGKTFAGNVTVGNVSCENKAN